MRQWKCPDCGAWVDMTQLKHIHAVNTRRPTLAEMHAARTAGKDADALALQTDIQETTWQPHFERRDKPDE